MTVYIVQKQTKLDERTGDQVPRFKTIEKAERFGELRFLLSSNASPFNPGPIVEELQTKLENFCDDDHLLLIGNPVLIGLSLAIAADYNNGHVSLLQWSGKEQDYINVDVRDIFVDLDVWEAGV